jgi:hypothetical protein
MAGTHLLRRATLASFTLAAAVVAAPAVQAQFVVDSGKLPTGAGIDSSSENVDFGDVDNDGDWDIALADGGDDGNDQNRIWINQGGLQGGVRGVFADETATRCPVILDQSRDVEFVDFDNDGDIDLYTSNTAQGSPQGNRWWTNLGGKQGGTRGFYADETSTRWVGLGGPGSSIAPSQVLLGNTFLDWSCDCDFGDIDNDGDLDLVHASYGQAFAGNVPTRLFLNDGDGHFSEFNPSGFQLPLATIADGQPGLWCEGVQKANTTNTTGAECDVASSALDVDLGDIDGDFDLDILHGARKEAPRMFANRLQGSTLAPAAPSLAFRDVTGAVFPPGYWSGESHYEQELADLDLDGDLDILGMDWLTVLFTFDDITLENAGDGTFSNLTVLAGSSSDDNEGDFLDYDNDGDLDVYAANFSGNDKLYRNDHSGGSGFSFTKVTLPTFASTSLDADACDVDGDGDYDVVIAEDNMQANTLLTNVTQVPDTHAPYLPRVETVGSITAQAAGRPVRVQVYDNAPYYIVWYNDTWLRVNVGGIDLPPQPARCSLGQIFRGVLPGNLVGNLAYRFESSDEYGNVGTSQQVNLTGSYGGSFATSFGTGTAGTGGVPALSALSVPFPGSVLYLAVSSGAPAGTPAILVIGTQPIPGGVSVPGFLFLNVGGTLAFSANANLDANGDGVVGVPVTAGLPTGLKVYAQGFVLDPTGSGDLLASSKGLEIVTQ